MMRPTMHLRCRNIPHPASIGLVGVIEQLFINDDQTKWRWVRVPLVKTDAAIEGEGPPPISGTNKETSS